MGGDSISSTEESSLEQDFSRQSIETPTLSSQDGLSVRSENETMFGEFQDVGGPRVILDSLQYEANQRQSHKVYAEVLSSYDELRRRSEDLEEAKHKILSYTPGSWIDNVGGMTLKDYKVPETMSLLLVGPKGSGKSSLINKISRVFEDDGFASERAQVSYKSAAGDGTYFLQEYMIPRGSTSFCLYDTRSLSDNLSENLKLFKRWMTKGVRHGELVMRDNDNSRTKAIMKCRARENTHFSSKLRAVNFVIYVVNGISVLESINSRDETQKLYSQMIASTFNSPFLSFKDKKPVIVITHGDLLSLPNRVKIRVYLGELLGIPPRGQIFDIPESTDSATKLAIVDMIHHCLEHADRNLPTKGCFMNKITGSTIAAFLLVAVVILSIFANTGGYYQLSPKQHLQSKADVPPKQHEPSNVHIVPSGADVGSTNVHIDWHAIRHMWLGLDEH